MLLFYCYETRHCSYRAYGCLYPILLNGPDMAGMVKVLTITYCTARSSNDHFPAPNPLLERLFLAHSSAGARGRVVHRFHVESVSTVTMQSCGKDDFTFVYPGVTRRSESRLPTKFVNMRWLADKLWYPFFVWYCTNYKFCHSKSSARCLAN